MVGGEDQWYCPQHRQGGGGRTESVGAVRSPTRHDAVTIVYDVITSYFVTASRHGNHVHTAIHTICRHTTRYAYRRARAPELRET